MSMYVYGTVYVTLCVCVCVCVCVGAHVCACVCSRYQVFKGTPAFIVTVKDSDFQNKFLKKYKLAT